MKETSYTQSPLIEPSLFSSQKTSFSLGEIISTTSPVFYGNVDSETFPARRVSEPR